MLEELKLFFASKVGSEKDKFENIYRLVDHLEDKNLYPNFPAITNGVNEPECYIEGKKYMVFCANNYLGLSENSKVKEQAREAISKYGIGPGGSRVISGNVDVIESLEKQIKNLVGAEDCLTFPTGYMANIAVFKALMDSFYAGLPYSNGSGVIFSDEFNHGSIVDGCRLSYAKKVIFKHNDIDDLEKKLKSFRRANKLIVTEGVFSLDGEILDLPKYVELAKKYKAKIMIDDAHGVGLIGKNGGGTPEYHNCEKEVDINMGCMDKSMGGTGGYLCGSKRLIDYLRVAARSSILSSAIPCGMAGGVIESINIIKENSKLRKDLFEKAKFLRENLINLGFKVLGKDSLPAIPLYIGKEEIGVKFSEELYKRNILSPVVRWPAVPKGESRFRIIVMATHKKNQLEEYINACKEIGKKLNIL